MADMICKYRYGEKARILPCMMEWARRNQDELRCSGVQLHKSIRGPKNYTDCDAFDRKLLEALGKVRYPPATASKRFARQMEHAKRMTPSQRRFCYAIAHHFRRQIKAELVDEAMRRLQAIIGKNKNNAPQMAQIHADEGGERD